MTTTAAIKALDRPGSRWLAAACASMAESLARRRLTVVRPLSNGTYLHRHVDGVIVLRNALSRRTPRQQELDTNDIFCFGYIPQPGDTVLDIGAGCGEETVTFSRLVGPQGRVISIEAHPDTYQRLVLACRYNKLTNVTPLQLAVTDVEGTVTIDDRDLDGSESIAATIGRAGGTEVAGVTIDKIIASQDCERVDLLKMNIEGAEQLAIRGIAESLAKVRHVVISCHDFLVDPGFAGDPAWFATYDTVTAYLGSTGFKLLERRATDPRPCVQYYVYGSRGTGSSVS